MHVALCTPFKLAMRRLSPSTRFILADTRAPTDKIGPNVNLAVRLPPLPRLVLNSVLICFRFPMSHYPHSGPRLGAEEVLCSVILAINFLLSGFTVSLFLSTLF